MASPKKPVRETKRYWLSYDLGLRGNYEGVYEWLDAQGAKECGDSLATFQSKKTAEEIRKELSELVDGTSKARIYLLSTSNTGKPTGTFLIGKRKAAPWTGYFQDAVESALDQ